MEILREYGLEGFAKSHTYYDKSLHAYQVGLPDLKRK